MLRVVYFSDLVPRLFVRGSACKSEKWVHQKMNISTHTPRQISQNKILHTHSTIVNNSWRLMQCWNYNDGFGFHSTRRAKQGHFGLFSNILLVFLSRGESRLSWSACLLLIIIVINRQSALFNHGKNATRTTASKLATISATSMETSCEEEEKSSNPRSSRICCRIGRCGQVAKTYMDIDDVALVFLAVDPLHMLFLLMPFKFFLQ
jgi:hypothetical protein